MGDLAEAGDVQRYELPLWQGGFRLRTPDVGIAPGPDALKVATDGGVRRVAYGEIAEVNITVSHQRASHDTHQIRIGLTDGSKIRVQNSDRWGNSDPRKVDDLYRFSADLHRRLVESGVAGKVQFTLGFGAARARIASAALALGAAFFLLMPLVLLMVTGDERALFAMVGGAFFIWPAIRSVRRNQPGTYDPEAPPGPDG